MCQWTISGQNGFLTGQQLRFQSCRPVMYIIHLRYCPFFVLNIQLHSHVENYTKLSSLQSHIYNRQIFKVDIIKQTFSTKIIVYTFFFYPNYISEILLLSKFLYIDIHILRTFLKWSITTLPYKLYYTLCYTVLAYTFKPFSTCITTLP